MAKIWVVEDDNVVAQLVARLLAASGYDVEQFSGGSQVIDLLRSGNIPDLLILDLLMPPPDGNDVLEVVAVIGNPPVILLSGHMSGLRENLADVPVACVYKPFKYDHLLGIVASAIKKNS